ncbi:MAG TPA: nucleoside deaminase [Alphaproteobacteria bacterium]|nr:nucleoside deaminase [Alphaproteobacteria bacterium]
MNDKNTALMQRAVALAQAVAARGEVPIAAVIANAQGQVIAEAANEVETNANPLHHAEMLALAAAVKAHGSKFLEGHTLAVTLEPCAMCAAALAHARVATLVFGAYDPKSGGTVSGARVLAHSHHKPEIIGGVLENECAQLLKTFFAERR